MESTKNGRHIRIYRVGVEWRRWGLGAGRREGVWVGVEVPVCYANWMKANGKKLFSSHAQNLCLARKRLTPSNNNNNNSRNGMESKRFSPNFLAVCMWQWCMTFSERAGVADTRQKCSECWSSAWWKLLSLLSIVDTDDNRAIDKAIDIYSWPTL